MSRTLFRTRKLALAVCAVALGAMGEAAPAATTVSQPFQGVTWYQRTETTPRLVVMNVVEIDLTFPGIGFTTTPSNGSAPGEVSPNTTKNFVALAGAQIGINGDFYSTASDGINRELSHLAMSAGQQVSPWSGSGSTREGALNISSGNVATIVRPFNVNNADYLVRPSSAQTQMYNAVGGNERLLSGGTVIATDTTIHPRTAVGVNGTKLYLFTVDGRQPGYSDGMNLVEIANLLKNDYGITDALNLDGGGSTSLVFADPTARTINRPSDGTDRVVANSLGVFAPLWPQWTRDGNGNYSATSNWAGGVPNGVGKQADFKNAITTGRTVSIDVPVTLGVLNLVNPNTYTFGGSGTLTLDASTGNAKINITSGGHVITAPVVFNDALDVATTAATSGLTFASINNPTSKAITKTGPGHFKVTGAQTHGPNTAINISGGSTTFAGALTVGAGSTLNLNTNLTMTGEFNLPTGSVLNLTGGNSTISTNVGGANRTAGLNVTGGKTQLGTNQRLTSLNVGNGAEVELSFAGNRIINTRSLTIAPTGTVDLVNNHMIVEYDTPGASPIGTFNGTQYTGITKFLATACNGGAWNGPGLTTSFIPGDTAVGIAEASDIFGLSGSETRPFGTELLDATTVVIKTCTPGDANMDLRVDIDDYFRIDYGFANKLSGWAWGDFNYDGRVTGADYDIIDSFYVQTTGLSPAGMGQFREAATVPEPAGVGIVLGAAVALSRSRKRRRS